MPCNPHIHHPILVAVARRQPWALVGVAACGGPAPCGDWSEPASAGYLARADISEASGLVASRSHAEVLWTHNDAGDAARVFALGADGSDQGELTLVDEEGEAMGASDQEDIAAGVGVDGSPWVYVGDIGDNEARRTQVEVLAFEEPEALGDQEVEAQAIQLLYPDGPQDAETLLFDPLDNGLYILTKASNGLSQVYRADPHAPGSQELEWVGELELGGQDLPGSRILTGGDISADGGEIILRTASNLFAWTREAGASLMDTLGGSACRGPTPAEEQGESIAISGGDLYTVGEGVGATLWRMEAR